MVKLKTKVDKHANDNEKRRKSLKEKAKARLSQSEIIRQALSNSSFDNGTSKKIVFDDDYVEANSGKELGKNGKSVLFDSSDGEDEDLEIREKSQFSGKKGFELLNLQSTYGNDERFKIDERFLEDEKEFEEENHKAANDEENAATEKAKQLKILESVLETPITRGENEKKGKKRTFEMIRYDESNKDHQIYEINTASEPMKPAKKRKDGRKTPKPDKEDLPKPQVSKEKFYEVSSDIKSSFKEKKEEGGQFSLLETYGLNKKEENEEVEKETDDEAVEEEEEEEDYLDEENIEIKNESKTDKREEKNLTPEPKTQENGVTAQGIWKEPFFFAQDDFRFKEALEFINKKDSTAATEAAENYEKTRKQIREVLRLHLKKQMHKKNPFKNKVGGMNKKQLANSKLKNPKGMFNKRKLPKMNPGRRRI